MTFRSDDAPCGRYESELRADYPAAMTLPEVLALAILELRTRVRCMELVRPAGVDEGRKRTDDDRDRLASEVERMQGTIDNPHADLERERMRLAAVATLASSRDPARISGMKPEYDSAALDDVRKLVAERTWQPIATAPRDGSRMLLWLPNNPPCPTVIGSWFDDYTTPGHWTPTHWMPLPAGPGQERQR